MVLSDELSDAARRGADAHFAQITEYLNAGGDVNDLNEDGRSMMSLNIIWEGGDDDTWMNVDDRLRIVRLLLARGADVDMTEANGSFPLFQACNCEDYTFGLGAICCLLEAGANVDQKRRVNNNAHPDESPLSTSLDWFRHDDYVQGDIGLSYVSLLLRYGPDLDGCWGDRSVEDCLRHIEEPKAFPELEGIYRTTLLPMENKEQFLACKKLIADERRRRFVAKRKEVLRLRSLLVRGRAKKSSDAMLEPSFRLPDGVVWNVLSFWPPRRPYLFLPASMYRPASTYAGPRPGFVFATVGRHTGYWTDTYDGPRPGWEFTTRDGRTGYHLAFSAPTALYRATGLPPKLHSLPARGWPEPPWPPADWLTGALAPDYRGPGYLPGNFPANRHLNSLRPRPS